MRNHSSHHSNWKDDAAFGKQRNRRKEPAMARKSFFVLISYSMLLAACAWLPLASIDADAANNVFLQRKINSSTIPENGDLNPYGIAFVPDGFPSGGVISPGDVLVSNFNDIMNCQ